MFIFKKPRNELEVILRGGKRRTPSIPDEMYTHCPSCKSAILTDELTGNINVCTKCEHHFYLNARYRIHMLADKGSFSEINGDMQSTNVIGFPDYEKKIERAQLISSENEAVVTGFCCINDNPCAIFVMEGSFMMGSMGTIVGEKITRLFEKATEQGLPVIGFTVSGGARMQEGILSLMQMAKTNGAVATHSNAGLLYITVLTNPTTGGVTASFAMAGDIILSEPGALICFAGPRVIAQTTRQKLPVGFQKAEFLLENGFIDAIVERSELKKTIGKLLWMHS